MIAGVAIGVRNAAAEATTTLISTGFAETPRSSAAASAIGTTISAVAVSLNAAMADPRCDRPVPLRDAARRSVDGGYSTSRPAVCNSSSSVSSTTSAEARATSVRPMVPSEEYTRLT